MFKRYFSSIRPEYYKLRKNLLEKYINHYKHCHCSLCSQNFPIELLDMAHLKRRCVLSPTEKMDVNNVEFMCKLCHSIYDRGFVGINGNGIIEPSYILNKYRNLSVVKQLGYMYSRYNPNNAIFLNWHYMNIFKNNKYG